MHADKQGFAGVELQVQEEEERGSSKHVTVPDTGSLLAVALPVPGRLPFPAMSQGQRWSRDWVGVEVLGQLRTSAAP